MIVIRYEGHPVAAVFADRIEFYPRVAVLETDHPVRRWVFSLAFFGVRILNRGLPGPFTERRAAHFVRCALLPDDEFELVSDHDDAELAEHFNVPLAQIQEKRRDLSALMGRRRAG